MRFQFVQRCGLKRVRTTRVPAWPEAHGRSCRIATRNGFAMLEVMITLVILLIALLGLAGIVARSNAAELESYQRVQALILIQDMVDRINANRKYAACYSNGSTGITLGTGYSGSPSCSATGSLTIAAERAQAVADLVSWDAMLKGATEIQGGQNVGAMIGARGCITQVDAPTRVYRISVAWQGMVGTTAPADLCGKASNAYGDESRRRVITTTVRIAKLL
jgi:type IV pilus assembly protein PilV